MPASRHGLVIGSVAASLAHVCAVRQKTSTEMQSAAQVVDTIGNMLQQRNLGTEELFNQISGYASAAVTPGASNGFETSLKAVVQNLEAQTEQSIKDGQTATQTKLDTLFRGLEAANIDGNNAKQTADANDKAWFECAADEQAKRQAAEVACKLQLDDKDFAFDATGKYKLDFTCNFMTGDCDAALQTFDQNPVKKMEHDATFALLESQADYNSLKAACDAAESAWSTKHAQCKKLASRREASLCTYGSKAQAKCTAESEYTKLVSDAKQAKGGAHSEVDREAEWTASQTTKCMVGRALTRGLNSALDSVDMEACAAKVSFAEGVGKLNTRQGELAKLAASNKCAGGSISFFNGQTWNIPAGAKPQSSAYTKTAFMPQLDPSAGNFQFCSGGPAPAPAPAPAPINCQAVVAQADMSGAQGDFKITARIQTKHAAGTIFAKAFAKGLWKSGGSAGQGKMLFLRNGKVCFDIGWVGVVTGTTRVNDGQDHEVGVEFAGGKYHVLVDGKREASGLRSIADHPDLEFSVGKSIGHKIIGDVANGDMAPAFQGSITALSNGHC